MTRRLLENAFVIFGLLVLVGVFVGAIFLAFFWRPTSRFGAAPAASETPELRAARCAAPPADLRVLARSRALALAEGDSLGSAAEAEALVAGDPPKQRGYRLTRIGPGSLYELAGLCDGDEVLAVGGRALDGPEVALELYEQLKDSERIRVDLSRAGRPYITTIELR